MFPRFSYQCWFKFDKADVPNLFFLKTFAIRWVLLLQLAESLLQCNLNKLMYSSVIVNKLKRETVTLSLNTSWCCNVPVHVLLGKAWNHLSSHAIASLALVAYQSRITLNSVPVFSPGKLHTLQPLKRLWYSQISAISVS